MNQSWKERMVAVRFSCTSKLATSVSVKAGLACVADLSVGCSTQKLTGYEGREGSIRLTRNAVITVLKTGFLDVSTDGEARGVRGLRLRVLTL